MFPNQTTDPLLRAALDATCESTAIDFKAKLDVYNKGEWLEVIKDLVAMANSGGGVILFGVDDSAVATGANVQPILDFDASRIGDKLRKYTGIPFGGFTLHSAQRGAFQIAAIQVCASQTPVAFTADGQYTNEHGQERFAFRQGSVYFRHGAKSEPGTTEDLRAFVERELERVKGSWLRGIRQIVEAPPGAVVSVGVPVHTSPDGFASRVRLVEDSDAAGVVLMDPNKSHPHRLKDVVAEVNRRVPDGVRVSPHDLLGIRRLYQTDSNLSYRYKPNTGSGQYSEGFICWIVQQIGQTDEFLRELRARHHEWIIKPSARTLGSAQPTIDSRDSRKQQ